MDTIFVAVILTFVGIAISLLLGWAESTEPFDPRKLFSAVVRGGVGGLAVALFYVESHPILVPIDYVVLLFTPMGLDYGIGMGWKVYKKGEAAVQTVA